MQAIEWTPPLASASRMVPVASAEAEASTEAETVVEAAAAAEEEAVVTAEENVAAVPGKGKEVVDTLSKEKEFDLRHLGSQELSEAEKEELEEYGKFCGYQPGSMLFGGVDEEILGCIRNRAGAKIIDTMSKSVGFPKLESYISGYRRQHIIGSLFYSNFKVKFFCLDSFIFVMN
jgi:hypothetical protein